MLSVRNQGVTREPVVKQVVEEQAGTMLGDEMLLRLRNFRARKIGAAAQTQDQQRMVHNMCGLRPG